MSIKTIVVRETHGRYSERRVDCGKVSWICYKFIQYCRTGLAEFINEQGAKSTRQEFSDPQNDSFVSYV